MEIYINLIRVFVDLKHRTAKVNNKKVIHLFRKKKSYEISVSLITRVTNLFNFKSWEIQDNSEGDSSLFNRFCRMLSSLDEEQQDLMLELTERYLLLEMSKYYQQLRSVCDIINDSGALKKQYNNIYIMPLIAPADIGRNKSSMLIAYTFKSTGVGFWPLFCEKSVTVIDNLNGLPKNFNVSANKILFLVDDFIGTGETGEAALNHVTAHGIIQQKVFVVSLVSLKEGFEHLKSLGFKVFSSIIMNKGISENYTSTEVSKKLQIMHSIEKLLAVKRIEQLGYKGSEALVTMIRTPNNTFPAFWKENKVFSSPFPR